MTSLFTGLKHWLDSWKNFFRYQSLSHELREITFYSEEAGYWVFFKPIVESLIQDHGRSICYLTSDPYDPILLSNRDAIQGFYIGAASARVALFRALNSGILVTSTPDLNTHILKRSPFPVHYAYVFHTMVSTHMIYRARAFDHFDSILCVGSHQISEIREREKLRNLPEKKLFEHGYAPLDSIIEFGKSMPPPAVENNGSLKIILAPSWGDHSILNTCGQEIVRILLDQGHQVTVRAHSRTQQFTPQIINRLEEEFSENSNFKLDKNISAFEVYSQNHVMISDWSGAALEFAFGLERPVLYIDVPKKLNNKQFDLMKSVPIEEWMREEIGIVISPDRLTGLPAAINRLNAENQNFSEKIKRIRDDTIFNVTNSGKSGADIIVGITEDLAPKTKRAT